MHEPWANLCILLLKNNFSWFFSNVFNIVRVFLNLGNSLAAKELLSESLDSWIILHHGSLCSGFYKTHLFSWLSSSSLNCLHPHTLVKGRHMWATHQILTWFNLRKLTTYFFSWLNRRLVSRSQIPLTCCRVMSADKCTIEHDISLICKWRCSASNLIFPHWIGRHFTERRIVFIFHNVDGKWSPMSLMDFTLLSQILLIVMTCLGLLWWLCW